jgi:DNA-binding Lrp family transcriptional regulator
LVPAAAYNAVAPAAAVSSCAADTRNAIDTSRQHVTLTVGNITARYAAPIVVDKRSRLLKLDRIDIKILHELQKNGRVTNVELADLVNLSPSPCLMRVKKLQSEGYIDGYSAQINVNKLGQTLTVFTEITLKNHRQIDFARFLSSIEKIDQVMECHLVSGGYDYLLKFITAGISEYQEIMERLTDLEIGIDRYFSFVVLKSPIVKSHMPLTSLFPL